MLSQIGNAGHAEAVGYVADHRQELGGTRVLFNALVRGDIDVYGEYTGTIIQEILAELNLRTEDQLGALDPMIRFSLQEDLRNIFKTLCKTVVLVTHDLGEAAVFL